MGAILNNELPAEYQYINIYNSEISPSTIHCNNATLTRYFRTQYLNRALSVYKFTLPKNWSKSYFLYCLYVFGYIAVVNTDKYGIIPQACGLQGFNIFFEPSDVVISNPLISNILNVKIGKQTELIKLTPDFRGVMDVINYYADYASLFSETMATNLTNSKLAYVFMSKDKKSAESFKRMFDQIQSGDPAVFADSKLFNESMDNFRTFTQNLSGNYIMGDLINDFRQMENLFNSYFGIPNSNTTKKERLITDEVNANNVETVSIASVMFESLTESIAKVRDMFGLSENELNVEWRFPQDTENETEVLTDEP